ncbi:MAG: hypothetical protein ACK4NP_12690 [Parvularculaceae bacterium]
MRVLPATLALLLAACAGPADSKGDTSPPAGEGAQSYPVDDLPVQEKTVEDLRAESLAAIDKEACEAKNGEIRQEGMLGTWRCVVPYADAGKACRDKSECEGKCLLPPDATAGTEEEATGGCQANDSPFGCYAEVNGGKVTAAICVD